MKYAETSQFTAFILFGTRRAFLRTLNLHSFSMIHIRCMNNSCEMFVSNEIRNIILCKRQCCFGRCEIFRVKSNKRISTNPNSKFVRNIYIFFTRKCNKCEQKSEREKEQFQIAIVWKTQWASFYFSFYDANVQALSTKEKVCVYQASQELDWISFYNIVKLRAHWMHSIRIWIANDIQLVSGWKKFDIKLLKIRSS